MLIAFDSVNYFDKNIDISDFNAEKKRACIPLMKFDFFLISLKVLFLLIFIYF